MVGCIKIRNLFTLFAGSNKCTRNNVGYYLCLRVQKNVSAIVFGYSLCLLVQKKYTRDVSEVTAVFAGSKKCTHNNIGCFSSSWVQKNVPAIGLVTLCVRVFKKMHPQ